MLSRLGWASNVLMMLFLLISLRENQNIFYFKKRKITRKFIDLKFNNPLGNDLTEEMNVIIEMDFVALNG